MTVAFPDRAGREAIKGRGASSAQQMPEHDHARVLAGAILEHLADAFSYATQALGMPDLGGFQNGALTFR